MIMNAWWPSNGILHNLPSGITPILTSIHINDASDNKTLALLEKNKDMYTRYGPVGTRDMDTFKAFAKTNIPTIFTACMTLFLKNFYKNKPRLEKTIAVDWPIQLLDVVKRKVGINLIELRHDVVNGKTTDEFYKFALADKYLTLYAQAKLVVTKRIHVALPCVAFGTPVILYGSGFTEQTRFSGLLDLFHTIDPNDMKSTENQVNYLESFDWEKPPPNPNPELYANFTHKTWSLLKRFKQLDDVREMFELYQENE